MIKVAIVGGGAAGMVAALFAIDKNVQVQIYEKNSSLGKKISVSGNGKCNITNANLALENFLGNDTTFASYALAKFGFLEFKKFCEDLGLCLTIKEDGKVYPLSNESKSVLRIFEMNLKKKGVKIFFSNTVNTIKKINDKFTIFFDDGSEKIYDRVLLCNGSSAASKLGGSNKGYDIAKSFGHKIEDVYPSLVQLETKSKSCAKMAGVKTEAIVTFNIDKYQKKIKGDVLFTKYGLSGFAILDISPYVSKALLEKQKVVISLNLLPKYNKDKLFSLFMRVKDRHLNYDVFTMLNGFIHSKIVKVLLSELELPKYTTLQNIDIKKMRNIVNKILNWQFDIDCTHGFEYAEVSAGGVSVAQINSKTMESKKVKNLYFAGELLDITGQRGGYNLAFAWASGYIAGFNIGKV